MLYSTDPKLEFVNYYGNTSMFSLDILRKSVKPINEMNLLSIGCLMPHLADYIGLFNHVHHNSMTETRLPVTPQSIADRYTEHRYDFFELPELNVDAVFSHAAIHCFSDPRYGNDSNETDQRKPYQAAGKLRQIIGSKKIPVVVSIAVNEQEGFFRDNVHLGHARFIESFKSAGFELRDYFFDYVCGGIAFKPEYLNCETRRSKTLPGVGPSGREWVVGNYWFVS